MKIETKHGQRVYTFTSFEIHALQQACVVAHHTYWDAERLRDDRLIKTKKVFEELKVRFKDELKIRYGLDAQAKCNSRNKAAQ